MSTTICRKYILNQKSDHPSISHFQLVEEQLNDLQDGEILIHAKYISADTFVRGGALEGKVLEAELGTVIPGSQVGVVAKSKNAEFPVNTLVWGWFGWRDYTIYRPGPGERNWNTIYRLPGYFVDGKISLSYALGAIGMPGITAYFAVEKILEIKNEGTLVVSTATGAVGNMVLQLGKMRGCKTLVFTSTDEKVIWLKTLAAGLIFNYNKINVESTLTDYAKEGIDFYFDNIGGTFSYHVMNHMKPHGRIAVCDAISCYGEVTTVPFSYLTIIDKRIRLEGFSVYELKESEWRNAMDEMARFILEGEIKPEETILKGFESLPKAFMDRFLGLVVGMQVVEVE